MNRNVFELFENGICASILVETDEYKGVKMIAEKSAQDIFLVTGVKPKIVSEKQVKGKNVVLYATVGKSKLIERLYKQGKINYDSVKGKREVYGIQIVEKPWEGTDNLLVIYGSEKRGTIYGIFTLSEMIGVSPLVYWGDAVPQRKESIVLDESVQRISKEPSVKYRGFFINDEWPCFGNWTFSHFGGFTASMYDHVYELLLRLKGNYLWPAMWSSSFALDGPGEESAKLAHEYGVIMGNSHHEPCLRASEEWDIYRGEETPYGDKWNYIANKDGLLNYWKDGLKRSSRYENIITMGMRGERDSMMEGTKTLQDNINVLKDIIAEQKKLIAAYGDNDMPKLLAIYKEVERYFYGDEDTPGLREWDGLDDLILMFCEDNYGNMRILPDKELQTHKGGFGMYYHFDYHGSPVSYEWVNSTPLVKIWEQMTECYEYGVRDVWMVNVGDLKGNEFPLSYFMNLAYNFETWGSSCKESPVLFTEKWLNQQFGTSISTEQQKELASLVTEGIWLTNLRKPESLHSYVYHPAHFGETDRILEKTKEIINKLEHFYNTLPQVCQPGYYSMIYYPVRSAMNLIQMHLYAGKNEHYARQGKKIANTYALFVTEAIEKDKLLAAEFASAFEGKWRGMEMAKHIGFCKWNEDGCRYPLRMQVEPFDRPRLIVSRSDDETVYVKNYGRVEQIVIREFLYPGTQAVNIEVANDGIGILHCKVDTKECPWLTCSFQEQNIEYQSILKVSCIEERMPEEMELATVEISDGDTTVELLVYGQKKKTENLPSMTFYEKDGITSIPARYYAKKQDGMLGQWMELEQYGKYAYGLKALPVTANFDLEKGPSVSYLVYVEEAGEHTVEVLSAPSNPLERKGRLRFGIKINEEDAMAIPSVEADYEGGEPGCASWSKGIVEQIHKTQIQVSLQSGVNEIKIFAMDAGFVLEKILVCKKGMKISMSYLGPEESWHKRK